MPNRFPRSSSMNPARGRCGKTCTNQARATARCSTSRRSTGVAGYTRTTSRGSTPGSTPRTRSCAGSAKWCVVATVRPRRIAGNAPANADRPLLAPPPPPPPPLPLLPSFLLPPKILPSSHKPPSTRTRGNVPPLPPKLSTARIPLPSLFPFTPYDEPLPEFKKVIHIKRVRISQSAASSSPPFPYRWRLDATAVESRRRRGGRRQCRCSMFRFSESRRRLVRRAAGPLPPFLSLSDCLLCAALFPFLSARLFLTAQLQQRAKK